MVKIELFGLFDLVKAQTLYIHKLTEVIVIFKNENLIIVVF